MKNWTREEIASAVNTNDHVLWGAIIALYNRQMEDEKSSETTLHNNNIGFNAADAKVMTSLAKQLICYRHLTERQNVLARRRIQKYMGQLERIKAGR